MDEQPQKHPCSQELVLNTICIKLENIEKCIVKIEAFQITYGDQIEAIRLNSAKYPSPDQVAKVVAKVDRHDTFFQIFGVAMVAAWGLILWIADKIWR